MWKTKLPYTCERPAHRAGRYSSTLGGSSRSVDRRIAPPKCVLPGRPGEIKTWQTACFFVAGHDIRGKTRVRPLRERCIYPVLWSGMAPVPPRMRRVGLGRRKVSSAEKRKFDLWKKRWTKRFFLRKSFCKNVFSSFFWYHEFLFFCSTFLTKFCSHTVCAYIILIRANGVRTKFCVSAPDFENFVKILFRTKLFVRILFF